MSRDNLHNESDKMDGLRRSFNSWEPGESADMWESLSESLSVDKVWNSVSDSLEKEQFAIDDQLRTGYGEWDNEAPSDLWTKIDESLSVENVWTNLDKSLAARTSPAGSGWFRIAAACILVLFFVSNTNDELMLTSDHNSPQSEDQRSSDLTISEKENAAESAEVFVAVGNTTNVHYTQRNIAQNVAVREQINQNVFNSGQPENSLKNAQRNELTAQNTENDSAQTEKENVAELPFNRYTNYAGLITSVFTKEKKRYNHLLIQLGSQLAMLRDTDNSNLSTSKTRVGLAADIAYRQRFGNLQLTGAFGISQYEQAQGKYVNARYRNTHQKINMAQLSLCLGYNYGRAHFYAGPMLSNALTALEFNGNTITQVYNFRTIEPGLTAGVDYQLFDLRRRNNALIIGAQYQYLPDNKLNSNLNQIHGLRIQAKFSF